MNLDPRYVIAPALEQFYIDKNTGLPLADGKITFYKDNARTILKSIYTLSGSPSNTSISLPNPLILSAVGTVQDANGNNVLPFYFPYDEQGNVELYYVTIENADGVLQFTREAWPNVVINDNNNVNNLTNRIPNGQFLLHNTIPAQQNKVAGEITQAVTIIAPGGWTFHRPEQSTAKDLVVFERFGSAVANPSGYPRYALRIENQLPSPGDLIKDLRIHFANVNRFASNDQYYTLAFTAQTHTGNALNVTVLLIKAFGESGSPQEEKIIDTITITASYTMINIPFIFGENKNKTLGLKNDDTVAIALRFPTNSVFEVSLTDFILTEGNVIIQDYPHITDANVISQSLAGGLPVPQADGVDHYLPIVATQTGLSFYDGDIGKVYAVLYSKPGIGELLCDGRRYLRSGYSPDGIPYARLAKKLWDEERGYYQSGTGITFVTANGDAQNKLILSTNQSGNANNASVGTSGFVVETVFIGNDYGLTTFIGKNPKQVTCQGNAIGHVAAASAENSGFTISDIRNSPVIKYLFQIECTEANYLAGKYFNFNTTASAYYVWFTVDGQGNDPRPGGRIGIHLALSSTQTAEEVALYLVECLSGHQLTSIHCVEANKIKPGNYWTFATHTPENFYVWYKKDNKAADPKPGGIGIPVEILDSDTAQQVAEKTKLAINQFYFAVPDLRGAFLRGWDKDSQIDTGDRFFSYGQGLIKNNLGSFQLDEILSHAHEYVPLTHFHTFQNGPNPNTGDSPAIYLTSYSGGSESRPLNFAVNFVMKY